MRTTLLLLAALVTTPACVTTDAPTAVAACPQCQQQCQSAGLCELSDDGLCVATMTGCAASALCVEGGWCAEQDGACITTPQGCAAALVCTHGGLCQDDDGRRCVADAEGCARSVLCATEGKCCDGGSYCVGCE